MHIILISPSYTNVQCDVGTSIYLNKQREVVGQIVPLEIWQNSMYFG